MGSHLHRMRWRLELSRELWIQNIEDFDHRLSTLLNMYRLMEGVAHAL